MNNVSKVKIAVGYTLLLAVLFFPCFSYTGKWRTLFLLMTAMYNGQTACLP